LAGRSGRNFFLECGARANKIRVYEMVDDPVAREMVAYLGLRAGSKTARRVMRSG
jgi:Mn-containing catalase